MSATTTLTLPAGSIIMLRSALSAPGWAKDVQSLKRGSTAGRTYLARQDEDVAAVVELQIPAGDYEVLRRCVQATLARGGFPVNEFSEALLDVFGGE